MKPRILGQVQAQAVYDAMCALNNVSGVVKRIVIGNDLVIRENGLAAILVENKANWDEETYATQHDFALAYGLAAA